MASGSQLREPPSPSQQTEITTTAVYEFVKHFLSTAKTKFDELDGPSKQLKYKTIIANAVGGVVGAGLFVGGCALGAGVVPTLCGVSAAVGTKMIGKGVAALGMGKGLGALVKERIKKSDKLKQSKRKSAVALAINAPSSKTFKETFHRLFIEIAYRIYKTYKSSFEYISTKTKSNNISKHSKLQVIQALAEYAASAYFNFILKYETLENLELLFTEEYLTEAQGSLTSLKMYFWVSKNGGEPMRLKINPYEFFLKKFFNPSNKVFRKIHPSFCEKVSWKKTKSVLVKTEMSEHTSFFTYRGGALGQTMSLLDSIKYWIGRDGSFDWNDAVWLTLDDIQKTQDMIREELVEIKEAVRERPVNTPLQVAELEKISFQVSTIHCTVYGRLQFVDDLRAEISAHRDKPRFVIVGTGGVGKTTVVRKFIELHHKDSYEHIIWIDAEHIPNAQNQFRKLAAEKLNIQVDTTAENTTTADFSILREEIYEKLCRYQARVLIVLDNAEAMTGTGKDTEQHTTGIGIQSLLPQSLPVSYIHPTVLITSREKTWDRSIYQTVNLDLWTEGECTDFVLEKLELPATDENSATARDLGTRFGRLPIAMNSAISIILKQVDIKQHEGPVSYGIQDLIHDYESGTKCKELNPSGQFPEISLWDVSLRKICQNENGTLAIKIICFMAYLSPNAIPKDFIRSLFEGTTSESDRLNKAFKLLVDYSLITFFGSHYTINRMIQEAVIQNLKLIVSNPSIFTDATFPNENDVLTNLSKQLYAYLIKMNEKDALAVQYSDVIDNCLHATHHVSKKLSIPECSKLTERVANIMEKICNCDKAVELYTKLIASIDLATDADLNKLLEIKDKLGSVLEYQGKFKEALQVFSEILTVQIQVLGKNHPSTLETQTSVINVLLQLERRDEASVKFSEVQEDIKKMTHLEDPAVLTAKYNFACLLYSYLEEYDDALELFEKVLEEYEQSSEPDQLGILRTQSMIADTLSKQEKHDEAVKRSWKVQKAAKEKLGPTNKETLTYRNNYAYVLYVQGKLKEALKVYEEVAKDEETLKESQYPNRSVTKHSIASVLTDLGDFDKAVEVLMNLLDVKLNEYGAEHPLTLDTMHYLAVTLRKQENYVESINIYQQVLKGRSKKFGPCHSDTLMTKQNIGCAYFHKGEFKSSERIARDVLSTRDEVVNRLHKFNYSEAEVLLRESLASLPLRTRLHRRIKSLFNFDAALDQSARGIKSKEKSKEKLDELYGVTTTKTVETCTDDEDVDEPEVEGDN